MFTIGHLNICSLRNKVTDLEIFLSNSTIKYDIFGISESRLNENIPENFLHIQNYILHRRDASQPGETGLAVYIKEDVQNSIIFRKDLVFDNIECIWLEVITKKKKNPQFVCILYRNGKTTINNYCEYFIKMMEKIIDLSRSPEIIIMGDFNIDLINPPQKWLQTIKMFNLHSLINTPTRITQKTATCIDHCYTNTKKGIHNFGIGTLGISDHSPIFCSKSSIELKNTNKNHVYIQFRSMKHFNKEMFLSDLKEVPFDNVLSTTNPDSALDIFYSLFNTVLNKHAPIKKIRVKNSEFQRHHSQELITEMKKRDQLKKDNLDDEYKRSKNKCKVLQKKSDKIIFQNLIKENSSKSHPNVSLIWKALNIFINKNCLNRKSNPHFNPEEFNNFFLSIPKTLINSTSFDQYILPQQLIDFCHKHRNTADQFRIPTLTIYDIEKIIDSLPNKKSSGIDEVNTELIKLAKHMISPSLTYILNLCIENNYFPTILKTAKVIPLKKVKSPTSINEYRPIALLPIISKILEKHIQGHLMSFLEKRNLIHIFQSGFRETHSCSTALTYLTDCWLKAINNSEISGAVFLDFSKAFDMINHNILLEKLPLYIGKTSLDLFKSFLNNRTQQVYINGTFSKPGNVEYGVPQGSILGPILFLLYINDLPLCLTSSNIQCHMLADDTTLNFKDKSIDKIQASLQTSLNEINIWCKNNHMVINTSKTKSMVITTQQKHSRSQLKLQLKIGNNQIDQVNQHKLLGVTIDESLKWNIHINNIAKKISKTLYLLYRLKNVIDTQTKLLFFNAFIKCHIDYCSNSWGNADRTCLKKLDSLHRRSIKLIQSENKTSSTLEKMNELHVLTLENQIKFNKGILIHKTLANVTPKYLTSSISQSQIRPTRLIVPQSRVNIYQKSFSYSATKLWNSMPSNIIKNRSLFLFKKSFRNHLLQTQKETNNFSSK